MNVQSTVETVKDTSGHVAEVVQQGLESVGSRLGLVEPPRRRRISPWLAVAVVVVLAAVTLLVAWRKRSRPVLDGGGVVPEEATSSPRWSRSA